MSYKNSFLLFLLFMMPFFIHSNVKESFIDLEKYKQTNTNNIQISTESVKETISIQEEMRKQQVIDFVNTQEQRNEEKRKQNAKIRLSIEFQEDPFMIPEQNHKFTPIDAIVLDAGHGGKDPGGISNGIEEKRLVLTLVKKIHTLFRKKNKKIKMYVTRKNDAFVSLEDRVSKTARWSARKNILFVSVHGNIAYNPRVLGFEIYTLSDKASDTDALATERIENAGFTPEDIEKTDTLYSILADLIRDGTRKQSEWLAQYIYDDTLKNSGMYGRGLKRANFFVLKYNTVPSILVEVGYMSNTAEAKRLKDESYQNQLAIGIYQGISRYIKEYNRTEGFTK